MLQLLVLLLALQLLLLLLALLLLLPLRCRSQWRDDGEAPHPPAHLVMPFVWMKP